MKRSFLTPKVLLLAGLSAITISLTACGGGTAANATKDTTATAAAPAADMDKRPTAADLVDLDLSSYDMPVVTKAPKDARVIKSTTAGELFVYGGKYFKLTFSKAETSAEDHVSTIKAMATDKEMNPSFDKLEVEDATGFIKKNKDGKLTFTYGVTTGSSSIVIQDGMTMDQSPDQFTDYTPEDIKLMYEAAKATVAKK